MNDKKSIAALIIIGIMLLLMPTYFRMLYGTDPQQVPADSTAATAQVEGEETFPRATPGNIVSESELNIATAPSLPQGLVGGRTITIVTPLYSADLNTKGAVFERWQLELFNMKNDENIQLIPENAYGPVIEVPVGDLRVSSTDFVFESISPNTIWLQEADIAELVLQADLGDGRRIIRTMRFSGTTYDVMIRDSFEGFEATPLNDAYNLLWLGGLNLTEEARKDEIRLTGFFAYQGGEIHHTKLKKETVEENLSGSIDWAALRTKYFSSILIPVNGPFRSASMDGVVGDVGPARMNMTLDRKIPVGMGGSVETLMYMGPIDYRTFIDYDVGLQKMMDFGWLFIRPIAKVSLLIFTFLYEFIPNYGVVIIIFSFLVKILVFPLTKKFFASMHAMQELAPKMQEIKEKYKDNPEKMNKKIMNLYKENKVNPLGGCFPMLLQMPVFYALFVILRTTIELRGAPFVLWIQDLSVMDPYMVLPGLMSLTMLVQQRAQMKDPRQRPMAIIMPVMFFFLFRNFPAGLTLYWTLFNILSILQTELIHKKPEKAAA